MSNVYTNYALGYKKEYCLLRGIDKYFRYYFENLDKIHTGLVEEEKNIKRVNKIYKLLDLFDKLHPPNTPLNEMDIAEVDYSYILLEQLGDFTDHYVNEALEFDEERFKRCVDGDFPGWTKLVKTIKRFHSKFEKVDKYPISLGFFDPDEFDESDESDEE